MPYALPTTGYCTLQEVRDEGLSETQASDARVEKLIVQARRYIDQITGRFFDAQDGDYLLDGNGGRGIQLDHPIISITSLFHDIDEPGDTAIDPDDYVVYNRHMDGLFSPDDRDNPRIELKGESRRVNAVGYPGAQSTRYITFPGQFSAGDQNVRVVGRFGYTDPDGSADGETPVAIVEVAIALVIRYAPQKADTGAYDEATKRHRVIEEKTKQQTIKLQALAQIGAFTGDPEIDNVLAAYMRPPIFGSA